VGDRFAQTMAAEIFGTAAIFWVLIPVGLAGGALLLKLQGDD
jgi:cytochrome b6-f complex subunit 7